MSIVTISPSGGNDTSALQSAINSTASAGNTLQLQAGAFSTNPLTLPTNSNIQLVSGVTVNANSIYGSNQCMLNVTGSNVTISGAGASSSVFQLQGPGSYSSEFNHCLKIDSGAPNGAGDSGPFLNNITVSGCSFNSSGGDGLYMRYANTVNVSNCIFYNNRRQGSSITGGVNHIRYNNCQFKNTNGTGPSAGIDIEPNLPGDFLLDIQITDCTCSNNQGAGIDFSVWRLDGTSHPISIHVLRHTNTGNGGLSGYGYAGYLANNGGSSNPDGYILIENSSTANDAYWGACARFWAANGTALIFKNLTVSNPHVSGPDPSYHDSAAVATAGGAGNTPPVGNVHYLNTNISITNGKTDHYFNFATNGSSGVSNVQFVPGTLSGATSSTMGLWNGAASGPIH